MRSFLRPLSDAARLAARQVAADGTTKLLLRLADSRTVETVLMPDFREDRAAGCLSSQVGCALGCDFCATAKTGFERNLTAVRRLADNALAELRARGVVAHPRRPRGPDIDAACGQLRRRAARPW